MAPSHPVGWVSWGEFNAQAREAIEGAGDGAELATAWGVVCDAVGVMRGATPTAALRMVVLARLRDFDARTNEFFDAGRVKAQSEREAFVERFETFGFGAAL